MPPERVRNMGYAIKTENLIKRYKDKTAVTGLTLAVNEGELIALLGVIGLTFAMCAYIYEVEKIGFIIQSIIYFVITSAVCVGITMLLWQLHRYPAAFICTLSGYAATHVIMMVIEYRKLKADIKVINELSAE